MKIEVFQKKFHKLRQRGFVPSHRSGPTGIGKTLEEELGITENNIALPDLPFAELKAHRIGSQSMITLFTFNKKVWKINQLDAIRKYGTPDENGRLGIYFTMNDKLNSAGLFICFEQKSIDLRHKDGTLIASWSLDVLVQRFKEKFPALVLVHAETEERKGKEYFHFVRAQLLSGVNDTTLSQQFREGNILLDLRLHDKGTSARNHGTGFRAFERSLPQIFTSSIEL